MLRSKALKNALATLLLLTVFAVLIQGILHEAWQESDHACCSSADMAITSPEQADDCHSEHQSCSSLSCSHGTLFLAESAFCWQTFGQIELLKFTNTSQRLPIIAANFFKPPRVSIG
ncbi:MAG: hypothetical protein CVV42_16330 [Candidatus Riflebacteria bacterium HGW-Riflebacteria-2]|nr:MAG: hypothetical protein CVV42_16330 [Candidatus Riflebacteria bacterium HGW-Riflebacteria-2]